ncbi:glycosyltransferase [uncultured Psychroserpens sp.]|uniref:glycosyltransferase family 2 protein n=1 Tax=uncultured Psychroserpens sp. TaxID=255436 RepID=UPI00261B4ACA|nr:glycosyltransferase [uncultured Psychroserpens sp.]
MPNNKPLVTIILPVYNGEKTIRATLDSLLNQTYSHFKLLICIDGTNDASKSIAESFKDDRVSIFENTTNLGLGDNLNKLLTLIPKESDLIAMAEQDDFYVPQRLEWQVNVMTEHPKVGLVSGIVEYKNNTRSVMFPGILVKGNQFPQGVDLFKYLYVHQLKVVNSCMMFRKSVHVNHELHFRNTYGNFNIDWDYILRFALVSKIHGIPKKLVVMDRGRANDSVTRDKDAQHKATRQLLVDFKKAFPDIISNQLYKEALKEHRKIELGHNSKLKLLFKSVSYSILYLDAYFLKYAFRKTKKYLIK